MAVGFDDPAPDDDAGDADDGAGRGASGVTGAGGAMTAGGLEIFPTATPDVCGVCCGAVGVPGNQCPNVVAICSSIFSPIRQV